jgi:hypothetical protein
MLVGFILTSRMMLILMQLRCPGIESCVYRHYVEVILYHVLGIFVIIGLTLLVNNYKYNDSEQYKEDSGIQTSGEPS